MKETIKGLLALTICGASAWFGMPLIWGDGQLHMWVMVHGAGMALTAIASDKPSTEEAPGYLLLMCVWPLLVLGSVTLKASDE